MADNPDPKPEPQPPPKALPLQQSSGQTGKLKSPTTLLPSARGGAGKIVVMLSSVAKTPANTQSIPIVAPPLKAPPNLAKSTSAQIVKQPAPLAPKQVKLAAPITTDADRLSSTTFVKLPPKTTAPGWSPTVTKPMTSEKEAAPLLPPKLPEPGASPVKKTGAQHIPPIKLSEPSSDASEPDDSILLQPGVAPLKPQSKPEAKPEGWKSLEKGELNPPPGGVEKLDAFARSQKLAQKPTLTDAKSAPAPVVPPMLPKETPDDPKPALNAAPVSLPSAHPVHHAPPMKESETVPEPPAEKLPQPHLPGEAKKNEPGKTEKAQAPAPPPILIPAATPAIEPVKPPVVSDDKAEVNSVVEDKKPAPVVESITPPKIPAVAETKPALKPAVLPKRALPLPEKSESEVPPVVPATPLEAKKAEEPAKLATASKVESKIEEMKRTSSVRVDFTKAAQSEDKKEVVAAVSVAAAGLAAKAIADKAATEKSEPAKASPAEAKRPALPLTRTERAKKRRLVNTLIFWLVMVPITGFALVMGSFYFGRDTRVEGQVIPPPGMTVNTEVWVVSDFRDLASGIAEDLAAERTPINQEIQERREHVQRIQSDIGTREERIRLINDEIQAAKDEKISLSKKARDETQQIWDGEGAAIDGDYESKLGQFKHAIADRAKSLNLKYVADDTYQSPEVWANAYRLALYQVPTGVDALKEHQWLSDQMKQWRDFQKSLDERKVQLRAKAAAKSQEPAQKIADLSAKMDDLGQRIDATTAEEVPLKAELQQAQADLAQAQSADQGLDDKYYKQLYSLPVENITYHIPVAPNGRFTWVQDEAFSAGETARKYWIFSRATRSDGRQYWALGRISIEKNHKLCVMLDPESFVSTKAILRPNLSSEEQGQ